MLSPVVNGYAKARSAGKHLYFYHHMFVFLALLGAAAGSLEDEFGFAPPHGARAVVQLRNMSQLMLQAVEWSSWAPWGPMENIFVPV